MLDFEALKIRLKIVAAIGLAGAAFFYWNVRSTRLQLDGELAQERESMRQEAAQTERVWGLSGPPEKQLADLRAILAAPRSAQEGEAAQGRLPFALLEAFKAAGRAGDLETADALEAELRGLPKGADLDRSIQYERGYWLMEALKARDPAKIELYAPAVVAQKRDRSDSGGSPGLGELAAYRLEQWRADPDSDEKLEAASRLVPWWNPAVEDLRKRPKAELKKRCTRLMEAKLFSSAFACATALEDLVLRDRAMWGLAEEAEAAGRRGSRWMYSSGSWYEKIDGPELRAKARRRLIDGWLAEASEEEAQGRFEQARQLVAMAREHLGREGGSATELAALEERRSTLELRRAMADLKDARGRGIETLTPALRKGLSPELRAEVESRTREALRMARARSDFDAAVDLAAFQMSELGIPPEGDAFRREFLDCLKAVAEGVSGANRRVFVLTLLADAFPGEPEGAAAREQAVAKGFELLKARESSKGGLSLRGASGLQGHSVVTIQNRTSHHILLFYDGPERFFVRVNPYRQGSAVLRDGEYAHGVMASADEVLPSWGKDAYASSWGFDSYVIKRSGAGGDTTTDLTPSGDFTLLRAPGAGYSVDPKTGRVSRR